MGYHNTQGTHEYLLALTLLAASATASSQVLYGVGVKYDHDFATENNIGLNSVAQTSFVAGVRGKYGQLDGAFYGVRLDTDRFTDNIKGMEIGYGPAFPIGKAVVTTRAAVGKLSNRLGPNPTAYYRTFTVGVSYPLNKNVSPFVSYRYRPDQDLDKQDQYTIGMTYTPDSQKYQFQAGYRQTRNETGPILNGVTTQLLYVF